MHIRTFILGLILGFVMASTFPALAAATDRSVEYIFNRAFNSSTNTLTLKLS